MPSKLVLTLSGQNQETKELLFDIHQTDIAQEWAELLQEDLPKGIRERDRFYGFQPHQEACAKSLLQIKELIGKIKVAQPEIDFGTVDFSNWQQEVNRIHVNFADIHAVDETLSKEQHSLWHKLNVALHRLEDSSKQEQNKQKLGANKARIVVTFHVGRKKEVPESAFIEAPLNRSFGHVYINYASVGRHILEIFYSKDLDIPKEHIVPFRQMSSDFMVAFGPNRDSGYRVRNLKLLKDWFASNSEAFVALGLKWDPCALGIGHISVAKLQPPFSTEISAIAGFQKKLSEFDTVESVQIL